MRLASFAPLLTLSFVMVGQDTCPPVVLQGAATVTLAEFGSSGSVTGLGRQSDGSFTAYRYTAQTPYRLLGTTPNIQRAFYSCFGFPTRAQGNVPIAAVLSNKLGDTSGIVNFAALGTNGRQIAILATESRFFRTGLVVGYVNPDFTTRNQVNVEVGAGPSALLAGDFNNDQLQDAIAFSNGANFTAASVAYLQGTADGSFGAPVLNNLGGTFLGATAIDLNKDSRPDLIVSTQISSPLTYRMHVLINQGNGAFVATTLAQPVTCATPIAGDFNRDGNNDIVCSDSEKSLNVFAGNGDGTLRAPVNVPLGIRVREMTAGDLNGDGILDIAATGLSGAGFVAVLLGNGALGFPTQNRYAGSYSGEGLRLSDFDADGRLDVVQGVGEANALAFQRVNRLTVHFGRGDGTLDSAPLLRIPGSGSADVLAADFNGDGRTDVAYMAGNGTFHFYAGRATGGFAALDSASLLTGQVSSIEHVEAADLNGDGRADLVFVDSRQGLYAALNNGSGRFPSVTRIDSGSDLVHVSLGDLNGDGRPDLVVSNNGGTSPSAPGNVTLFTNNGSGTFTRGTTLTPGVKPLRSYLRDLNGDGRPDLVSVLNGLDPFAASTTSPGGVAVYLANAGGAFGSPTTYTIGRNPGEVGIGDLNGDNRDDLVVQTREGQFGDRIAIALNNGSGAFGAPRLLPTKFGPEKPSLVDLNGDSVLDIALPHCCGETYLGYYLGLGGGNFNPETELTSIVSLRSVTVADIDADGRPDLLGIDGQFEIERNLFVLRNASPRAGAASAVSAASFLGGRLAAGSIISLFGANLANGLVVNSEAVAPEELGGVSVSVRDIVGIERKAQIFFVSPSQVNALLPADTASGPVNISIKTASGALASAAVEVVDFAAGLFAATSDGLAAANLLRISEDGSRSVEPVVELNAAGQVVAKPIDLGPATEQVFLLLYGTGIRGRASTPTTTVSVAGANQVVQYAGAQGEFVGLDQVNIRLNRNLAGRGLVEIKLTQNFSLESNVIKVLIR